MAAPLTSRWFKVDLKDPTTNAVIAAGARVQWLGVRVESYQFTYVDGDGNVRDSIRQLHTAHFNLIPGELDIGNASGFYMELGSYRLTMVGLDTTATPPTASFTFAKL